MTHRACLLGALLAFSASASAPALGQADAQPLDTQARMLMWKGDASDALQLMREHVATHPGDQAAALDLARYLSWNGDYAAAKCVLDTHPEATQSPQGQVVLASLLAWAGRIDQAQSVNAPLLAQDPEGLLPNFTQAAALRQTARPRAALPYVAAVQKAKPDSKDARDLERIVRIRTDSFVALDYQHASDSDHLVRSMPTLRAELAQGEALRYTLELGRWDYRSPLSSPFANIDGSRALAETRGMFGLRYAPSLSTELSAAVGRSSIPGNGMTLWRFGVDERASDAWRLWFVVDHDRLAASPRSVSLGLDRTGLSGHVQWTPDFNWTGDLWLRRDHYNDSNSSVEWNAALRRAAVRQPHFSLDLGVVLQHLAYDQSSLGDGYYAPENYRRYALTANSYIGLSENVGLSLQAGLGRQRDENFTAWRRAIDASASLVVGIFSPWQLNLNAAYAERVQTAGAYQGHSWGMTLTRRF